MEKIYEMAIIGAGPAGIAVAVESHTMGIEDILLLEKSHSHSATIREFYKNGKRVDKEWKGQKIDCEGNIVFTEGTKESTLNLFEKLLAAHEIDTVFNTEAESVKKLDSIFVITTSNNQKFKAENVVIAIGKMGKPNRPDYKIPPQLRSKIDFNLDRCRPKEDILVVGGGNSAAEYACALVESNRVTLSYRKERFTKLNEENLQQIENYVKKGALRLKLNSQIEKIQQIDEKVGVFFRDKTVEKFDRIVYAIGGTTPVEFLKRCSLELKGDSLEVDENFMTPITGLFAAGDIVCDTGGSIVAALNHGYKIASYVAGRKRGVK